MDSFIVSARKYRPATFKMVVGQDTITHTLINAIRNEQLAQSFLFCGPRGVGKTTCARILAKTINCLNLTPDFEACEVCESCKSFKTNSSFNIYELDAASNNGVDEIRALIEQVRIPPQVGKYKVYIIDEVHMLSQAAFNAFLKTLEEPPSYAKFILATTDKHKIIPTILSRCQVYDFKRISVSDIVRYLQYVAENEHIDAESDALHIIAYKADGALRDALSIFDQLVSFSGNKLTYQTVLESLNVLDSEVYYRIVNAMVRGDIHVALKIFDEVISNGFDGQHFIIGLGAYLRNILISKDKNTLQLLEVSDIEKSRIEEQSPLCNYGFLIRNLDIINQADIHYRTSSNQRLMVELSLMQMCSTGKIIDTEPTHGESQKKKPDEPALIPPEPLTALVGEPITEKRPEPEKSPAVKDKVSIKEMFNSITSVKTDQEPGGITAEDNTVNYGSFTEDELLIAWDEMVKSLQDASPSLITALTTNKPFLNDNDEIELQIDNKLQESEIQFNRQEICDFLRNKLRTSPVRFHVTVVESSKNSLIYSPQDKFRSMAEKNPSLIRFRNEFDLDIDY